MRRVGVGIAATVACALLALGVTACGGSDPDEAKTPADAVTITNGQDTTAGDTGGEGGGEAGDAEAGKATFEGACQGCHPAGGTTAGAGPVLADKGLAAEAIKTQIVNGKGAMPGGLVSGADLDNVVAFVVSIQGEKAAEAPAAGGGEPPAAEGDVAAGKTFFETSCQGCHPAGGTTAGAGPVLTKKALAAAAIETQIVNGKGAMPGGLASGDDLTNVVAYVVSLQ